MLSFQDFIGKLKVTIFWKWCTFTLAYVQHYKNNNCKLLKKYFSISSCLVLSNKHSIISYCIFLNIEHCGGMTICDGEYMDIFLVRFISFKKKLKWFHFFTFLSKSEIYLLQNKISWIFFLDNWPQKMQQMIYLWAFYWLFKFKCF